MDEPTQGLAKLNARELQLAELVSEGLGNREIAKRMELKLNTIKVYMGRIFGKLQVKSRLQLALLIRDQVK